MKNLSLIIDYKQLSLSFCGYSINLNTIFQRNKSDENPNKIRVLPFKASDFGTT